MSEPLFSLIVPTLNRAYTLRYVLQTILSQGLTDYELIVSDNRSSDNTAEVVREVCGERAVYVKPDRRLSMSRHWEFAMAKARGRYVAFIGDDDGVTRHGLQIAAKLLADYDYPEALCSLNVEYHWPDSPIAGHESTVMVPVESGVRHRASAQMLGLIKRHTRYYFDLPMIYRGFVSRETLTGITQKCGGFFHSSIPDVYAAIAVAAATRSYVFTSIPLFIEGISGASNGAATTHKGVEADESFLLEDSIPWHSELKFFSTTMTMLMAESLLQARDVGLLGNDSLMSPRDIIAHGAQFCAALVPYRYEQTWIAIEHQAQKYHLEEYTETIRQQWPNQPSPVPDFPFCSTAYLRIYEPAIRVKLPGNSCTTVFDCMNLADQFRNDAEPESGIVGKVLMELASQKFTTETERARLERLHQFQSPLQDQFAASQAQALRAARRYENKSAEFEQKKHDWAQRNIRLKSRVEDLESNPSFSSLMKKWLKSFRGSRSPDQQEK